jgi:hypothetical protein
MMDDDVDEEEFTKPPPQKVSSSSSSSTGPKSSFDSVNKAVVDEEESDLEGIDLHRLRLNAEAEQSSMLSQRQTAASKLSVSSSDEILEFGRASSLPSFFSQGKADVDYDEAKSADSSGSQEDFNRLVSKYARSDE